jgi:hypothetical protein
MSLLVSETTRGVRESSTASTSCRSRGAIRRSRLAAGEDATRKRGIR